MPTGQSSYSANDGTIYYDLTTDTGDSAEINGALFFQSKPDSSSGTGLIQAFVRVQDGNDASPGFEDGYNTSFRPLSYEENTSPQFTTSLLLAEVPVVEIDGVQYYEFRLDINQVGGDLSLLSLDDIKLYSSAVADGLAQGTIDGTWFTNNATLVYDMDDSNLDGTADTNHSVLLDASNSTGSGTSDMFFYVPVANFNGADVNDTYVTLYSQFGSAGTLDAGDGLTALDDSTSAVGDSGVSNPTDIFGTYTANDGFEEWSVSKETGGFISGYKFEDLNGNGVWDSGEGGLGGWTFDYTIEYDEGHGHNTQHVVISDSVTTSDGTQDVDGDGIIDPLGFYSIAVPVSSDQHETYTITLTEQGQNGWVNTFDGDATADSTTTFTFSGDDLTLTSPDISGTFGETEEMNFGNFETFTISGHKYTDITGDGLSNDDTGLGGVTVFIDMTGDGLSVDDPQTTTSDGSTDANHDGNIDALDVGYWELTGLTAAVDGKEVQEVTPTGYIQTVGQVGIVTDTTTAYTLVATSGNDQTGFDFDNFLPDPEITIDKSVMTDISGAFLGADDPDGPAASTSTTVNFKVVVTNTGNESLSDITLSDSVIHTVNGVPSSPQTIVYTPDGDPSTLDAFDVFVDLDHSGTEDSGEAWINFDTDGDGVIDAGVIATLAPGDSFDLYYSLTSPLLGQHENTASVEAVSAISDTTVSDDNDANYYVLENEECVGVRTPGFWANTKWMTFWDGTPGNEPKQAGTPGFAAGELLYKIDTNKSGTIDGGDSNSAGLLIGDYNKNGITDAGEDTIYISLSDAQKLINASTKQLADGKTADGIYMLGRDLVATWLNYLANNPDDSTGGCIGSVDSGDGTNTPREYIDAAIDWLQQFASDQNSNNPNTNLNTTFHDGDVQAVFQFDGRIAPSSGAWQNPITTGEDIPVSAAAMHSALDGYNNTGAIGGTEYCCDADSELVLNVLFQVEQHDALLI